MLWMQPVDLVADIMPDIQSRPGRKDLDPPPAQVSRCQHALLTCSLFGVPCSETASKLPFPLSSAVPLVSIYNNDVSDY